MRYRSAATAMLTLSGFAAVIVPTPAYAQESANGSVTVVSHQSSAEIEAYWTPERLRSAEPAPIPVEDINARLLGRAGDDTTGPSRIISGVQPSSRSVAANAFVRVTAGRLWYTDGNGTNWRCSANVVSSNNRSTIASARHCGFDSGGHNYRFAPEYSQGSTPHGAWEWDRFEYFPGNFQQDIDTAFVALRRQNGRLIQDVVGASAIGFNQPPGPAVLFGLPTDIDTARSCSGNGYRGPQNQNLLDNCNGLSGGASGGPWLNYFNYGTQQGVQTGSYFGNYGDGRPTAAASSYGNYTEQMYHRIANAPIR